MRQDEGRPVASAQPGAKLLAQVVLARAATLAGAGNYEGALALLAGTAADRAALDLRARIAAQRGQLADARLAWEEARRLEPADAAAAAGLRWLDTTAPRRSSRLLAAGAVLLLVVAAIAVGAHAARSSLRGAITPLVEAVHRLEARAAAPARAPVAAAPAPAPLPPATGSAAARTPPTLRFDEPGVTTREEDGAVLVVFERALFPTRARMAPDGAELLTRVAQRLIPLAPSHHFEIIGHCDSRPSDRKSRFADPAMLALARATAAMRHVLRSSRIAAERISVRSAGLVDAPFPVDDARNRTITLRVTRIGEPS